MMSEQPNEARHTPGPWNFAFPQNPKTKEGALDVGIFADVNGERKIIAEAFGQVNYGNVAPARANARLIAAAPELLESLVNLIAWLEASDMHRTPSGGSGALRYQGTEYQQVTAARAALAKAREAVTA